MDAIKSADDRCACEQVGSMLAYDYLGQEITARLACVGMQGRPSCGWIGPMMTLEEAEVFEILAWVQSCLVATAPSVAKVLRPVATR